MDCFHGCTAIGLFIQEHKQHLIIKQICVISLIPMIPSPVIGLQLPEVMQLVVKASGKCSLRTPELPKVGNHCLIPAQISNRILATIHALWLMFGLVREDCTGLL